MINRLILFLYNRIVNIGSFSRSHELLTIGDLVGDWILPFQAMQLVVVRESLPSRVPTRFRDADALPQDVCELFGVDVPDAKVALEVGN